MYFNILTARLKVIIKKILKTKHTEEKPLLIYLELNLLKLLFLRQCFFQQTYGLTMGCPSPAILFLQYIKEMYIVQIARNHHLLGYFQCVDDVW
jgi:hypothetical protein